MVLQADATNWLQHYNVTTSGGRPDNQLSLRPTPRAGNLLATTEPNPAEIIGEHPAAPTVPALVCVLLPAVTATNPPGLIPAPIRRSDPEWATQAHCLKPGLA